VAEVPSKEFHGLDHPCHRRRLGVRLGDWSQVLAGFHPPRRVRDDDHSGGCQPLPALSCRPHAADRHSLPAALLGIILFHEPANVARIFFLSLITVGIVGLRFAGGK
jgi:hypothetical protein